MNPQDIGWIALDWGSSNLRLWVMSKAGSVVKTLHTDDGVLKHSADSLIDVLSRLVKPWLDEGKTIPIIACGMVGSQQGLVEAPYQLLPYPIDCVKLVQTKAVKRGVNLAVLCGLKRYNPNDVMRGEETQVLGFLTHYQDYQGVLCLPGTHSKWVQVNAQQIVNFQTFITGELFSLLNNQSILRHQADDTFCDVSFLKAVDKVFDRPAAITNYLFQIRADYLLSDSPVSTFSVISGYLIGLELLAAKPYWQNQQVSVIGSRKITPYYQLALNHLSVDAHVYEADKMTLAGLQKAYQLWQKQ